MGEEWFGMDLGELARLPTQWLLTPSPDGRRVAFFSEESGRFELYTVDVNRRVKHQHTHGEAPDAIRAAFVWTPDSRSIIFAKDIRGNEQNNLYQVDLDTDRVRQLNDDPASQEYAGPVSPDGRILLVLSNRDDQVNLYAFDLVAGGFRRLTHCRAPVHQPLWSPDGRYIAYTTNETTELHNADVHVMRADGSEPRRLYRRRVGSQEAAQDWHRDGRRLAVTSDADGHNRVGLLDWETGDVRWLTPHGVEERAARFSPDGRHLLAFRNEDATLMPVLYDVASGQTWAVPLPPGVTDAAGFVDGGRRLVVSHQTIATRAEVAMVDVMGGDPVPLIPAQYGTVAPGAFAPGSYVRYPSTDGTEVPAILLRPAVSASARHPALVMVHGGPTAQFLRSFNLLAQFLQDRGYVVLMSNVRGSTGYGVAWRDACLQDWGGRDLDDLEAAARHLAELDFVDPTRIGVLGGRYGGYLSYMAVAKRPDLFRVGVPMYGITDLAALYAESMTHFQYYLRQQMGDPQERADLWRDRSAITFADRVKAKLLILHGLNDPRCPAGQARRFRDRLLAAGKREGRTPEGDFEYHEFEDGHGAGGNVDGKLRDYRLVADFLSRRL